MFLIGTTPGRRKNSFNGSGQMTGDECGRSPCWIHFGARYQVASSLDKLEVSTAPAQEDFDEMSDQRLPFPGSHVRQLLPVLSST